MRGEPRPDPEFERAMARFTRAHENRNRHRLPYAPDSEDTMSDIPILQHTDIGTAASIVVSKLEAQRQEQQMNTESQVVMAPEARSPARRRVTAPADAAGMLSIISKLAADPATDVAKIRQLMDLHKEMEAAQAKKAFAHAFAQVQPRLPAIKRNGRLVINDKAGIQIQSTPYAKWEDIHAAVTPILGEYGLSLSFRIDNTAEGRIKITAVLLHEEGHEIETSMVLPIDASGSKNNVQGAGSSTSYGKRYTATALLNIRTEGEDDDGKAGGAAPAEPGPALLDDTQYEDIFALLKESGADREAFFQFFKIESLGDMKASDYARAKGMLETRMKKGARNHG